MADDELGLILPSRSSLVISCGDNRSCIVAVEPTGESNQDWIDAFDRAGIPRSDIKPLARRRLRVLIAACPVLLFIVTFSGSMFGAFVEKLTGVDGLTKAMAMSAFFAGNTFLFTHVGGFWRRPLHEAQLKRYPMASISLIIGMFAGTAGHEFFNQLGISILFGVAWLMIGACIGLSFVLIAWPRNG